MLSPLQGKSENVPRRKPCMKCFVKEQESSFLSTSLHLIFKSKDWLCLLWKIDSGIIMTSALYRERQMKMIFHFKSTFQFNLPSLLVQRHLGHSKTLTCTCLCYHGSKNLLWMDRRVGKQICFDLLETYFLFDNNRMPPVFLAPECIKWLMKVLSGTWISPRAKLWG